MDSETSVYEKLISQCKSNGVAYCQLASAFLTLTPSRRRCEGRFSHKATGRIREGKRQGASPTRIFLFFHILNYRCQVSDPDAIISILKSSLRTPNLHLTNATLSALPAILPLLISHSTSQAQLTAASLSSSVSTASVGSSGILDIVTLRQAMASFLPAGGVIDRLGDKERAQLKARDTLVLLGGFAFRSGSSSAKTGKGVETPIAIFERLLKEGGLASKVWKVREQVHVFLACTSLTVKLISPVFF
jgi:hypothetical protein